MMDCCQFPQNTPLTAYGKGCRCDRCRDAIRERDARYMEANREALRQKSARYREANREANREYAARYREANREALRQKSARYREANREANRERAARYREANRGFIRSENRERQAVRGLLTSATAARAGAKWTADEDRMLRTWRQTDAALAIALGRTHNAVVTRRYRLTRLA